MNVWTKLLLYFVFIATLLSVGGCQAVMPSPKFAVGFSTPENEPVYIEKAIYDDTWVGRGGIMLCCWKRTGAVNSLVPSPSVPKKLFIRWFNYRQQKYYEADVSLPENLKNTMWKLPSSRFGARYITTGVLPTGEVVVWISNGLSEKSGTWIEVARTRGHVVKGDPNDHRNTTEDMRKRGEI